MSDRPIIFSAPMVRALLGGRKTQTRRLATSPLRRCEVGDRLYVREAWSHTGDGVFEVSQARLVGRGGVIYRVDDNPKYPHAKFWPSLHMPREFSRLTLIVKGMRVEPLQAITDADSRAEGVERVDGKWREYTGRPIEPLSPHECYASLWQSLHTAAGQRWEDNPDVLVLTFRVVRGNIDQVEA